MSHEVIIATLIDHNSFLGGVSEPERQSCTTIGSLNYAFLTGFEWLMVHLCIFELVLFWYIRLIRIYIIYLWRLNHGVYGRRYREINTQRYPRGENRFIPPIKTSLTPLSTYWTGLNTGPNWFGKGMQSGLNRGYKTGFSPMCAGYWYPPPKDGL